MNVRGNGRLWEDVRDNEWPWVVLRGNGSLWVDVRG